MIKHYHTRIILRHAPVLNFSAGRADCRDSFGVPRRRNKSLSSRYVI
jgi:hypothetical protein